MTLEAQADPLFLGQRLAGELHSGTELLAEAMNLLGPLGWLVSAIITGSVTCTVGFTFWAWCERAPAWLTAKAIGTA